MFCEFGTEHEMINTRFAGRLIHALDFIWELQSFLLDAPARQRRVVVFTAYAVCPRSIPVGLVN